jgi:hypothetical protein
VAARPALPPIAVRYPRHLPSPSPGGEAGSEGCPSVSLRIPQLLLATVLGVLLVMALAGCQISQDAVKRDPFLQELVAAQQAGQPHKLGQPFDLDNTRWSIQSARIAYALQLGSTVLRARGEFVVVQFALENLSGATQPPEPDMLLLQSGQSRTFKPDVRTTALYTGWVHQVDFLTTPLKPNIPYTLSLVFDVPRGSGELGLAFHSYPNPHLPNESPF